MHHTASNSDSHINKNSLKCLYDSEKELPPDCENRLHLVMHSHTLCLYLDKIKIMSHIQGWKWLCLFLTKQTKQCLRMQKQSRCDEALSGRQASNNQSPFCPSCNQLDASTLHKNKPQRKLVTAASY